MPSIVGIDSRIFTRDSIKKDGSDGHFISVIGIAVKVKDYKEFSEKYREAIQKAFSIANTTYDYQFYCAHDLAGIEKKYEILDTFSKEISKHIEKIHFFYTLFSEKHLREVKVYGRMSKNKQLHLSSPTRTYEKLISEHLVQCFPAICAWRLTQHLTPRTTSFHLDSFEGHIFEGWEELEKKFNIFVYPSGDSCNPVISTADLLTDLIDKKLQSEKKFLIFENIRPALPEFGDNLLVYPISNKHLPKITPVDNISIKTLHLLKHPVFWVFKGDQLISSDFMKKSKVFRNLIDYAASQNGVVKMFNKSGDIDFVKEGDYGAYLNNKGRETIDSYKKMGKIFNLFNMDSMVPENQK